MDVDGAIAALIEREGGFVDHRNDRGGATRWGVTEAVARAHGYAGAMRDYPRESATQVYRRTYWARPRLDRIAARAPALAGELLDSAVNMGPGTAIRFLQRALNALNRGARDYADIARDGRVGPATLAALDAYLDRRGSRGEAVLVTACDALQGERYIALAERREANEAFVYGWLSNRTGSSSSAGDRA